MGSFKARRMRVKLKRLGGFPSEAAQGSKMGGGGDGMRMVCQGHR